MPVQIDDKTSDRASAVPRNLAGDLDDAWRGNPKLSSQSKIVAFISSGDDLGMPAILSDVAAAISALDKQVTLVLDIDDGESPGYIELLREMGDYLLVDLPFKPTPFASSILSGCDLVIVASSCKLDNIDETMKLVKVLLFLGIDPEKVAAILVDPEGILPSASLADIKPYLETSLGIEMAGVVSFDARSRQPSYRESQSKIPSGPDSQLARDIQQLAQYIK
jgi:Flp pilus assembly CpaE family ATPase